MGGGAAQVDNDMLILCFLWRPLLLTVSSAAADTSKECPEAGMYFLSVWRLLLEKECLALVCLWLMIK